MLTQMRNWIDSLLGRQSDEPTPQREGDYRDDSSMADPGENQEFVGRVAGNDDVGSVGETGAEARARSSEDSP